MACYQDIFIQLYIERWPHPPFSDLRVTAEYFAGKVLMSDHTLPDHMLLDSKTGDLVTRSPELAALFESLGINYCCDGDLPLREALAEAGVTEQLATPAVSADDEMRQVLDRARSIVNQLI